MTSIKEDKKSASSKKNYLLFWRIGAIVLILATIVFLAIAIRNDAEYLEKWIAERGAWGPVAFLVVFILLSSVFVPDTIFAIIAGTLFGLLWGTVLMFVGGLIGTILNYFIGKRFLGNHFRVFLKNHPKFSIVKHAAEREGIRLLFLLRMTPINPTIVSYILGAIRVRFSSFFIASFGLIPTFFVEVYFGYLVKHMSMVVSGPPEVHSRLHTMITLGGFAMCLIVLIYITHIARRALLLDH